MQEKKHKTSLRDYLNQRGISVPEFAVEIGINEQTLRNILKGYDPKLSTAWKIIKHTKLVHIETLLPTKIRAKRSSKFENPPADQNLTEP